MYFFLLVGAACGDRETGLMLSSVMRLWRRKVKCKQKMLKVTRMHQVIHSLFFLPRDAMQARSLLSSSVRLFVTFVDHVKMNKDIFEIFLSSGSDTILVFPSQRGCRYSNGNPLTGGVECEGYDKMTFSQISRCISETIIVRWAHAARQFVSIEFSFHPYNI